MLPVEEVHSLVLEQVARQAEVSISTTARAGKKRVGDSPRAHTPVPSPVPFAQVQAKLRQTAPAMQVWSSVTAWPVLPHAPPSAVPVGSGQASDIQLEDELTVGSVHSLVDGAKHTPELQYAFGLL